MECVAVNVVDVTEMIRENERWLDLEWQIITSATNYAIIKIPVQAGKGEKSIQIEFQSFYEYKGTICIKFIAQ